MSVQCKVFCCGEGLDFKAMGTIYSGLVQTGAWGCFDEFNRIPVEVLSVVSAQIKCIQAALTDNLEALHLRGARDRARLDGRHLHHDEPGLRRARRAARQPEGVVPPRCDVRART